MKQGQRGWGRVGGRVGSRQGEGQEVDSHQTMNHEDQEGQVSQEVDILF